MRLIFRPSADSEFTEAAAWYESQREGLGLEFIDQVQQVLDRIAENPKRYPVVHRDIHEGVVARFPFAVYYRVGPGRVIILAVFHCSRDPAIWQARN